MPSRPISACAATAAATSLTRPRPSRRMAIPASSLLPSFRLDGRRALVTRAGRGVRLAAAQALGEAGAEVALAARSAGEVGRAADAIRGGGGRAEALAVDVTDVAGFVATIEAA